MEPMHDRELINIVGEQYYEAATCLGVPYAAMPLISYRPLLVVAAEPLH